MFLEYSGKGPIVKEKNETYKDQVIFWKLISVYNAIDPMGLLTNVNIDEYDVEVKDILSQVNESNITKSSLSEIIQKVHIKNFEVPLNEEDLEALTMNIYLYLLEFF